MRSWQKHVGHTIVQFVHVRQRDGHLVPARMLAVAVQQARQVAGLERAAHRAVGALGHRVRGGDLRSSAATA